MTTQFHSQTAKFLSVLAQNMPNLSGDDMQYWIGNPSEVRPALARAFMREHDQKTAVIPSLQVRKTITIGTGIASGTAFCTTLKQKGLKVDDWTKGVLTQQAFPVTAERTAVDLVVRSVAELGFSHGAHYDDICAGAKEQGLDLCPADVGPQLRLQYVDQPLDEWLTIAMEPILTSVGHLFVFLVGHDEVGLRLSSLCGLPGRRWPPVSRFVFRARTQPLVA